MRKPFTRLPWAWFLKAATRVLRRFVRLSGARAKSAEFGEVLRTEVWHLMALPMRPRLRDGISFWRVGQQQFERNVAAFGCLRNRARGDCDLLSHAIPNDEELAGGEMAPDF